MLYRNTIQRVLRVPVAIGFILLTSGAYSAECVYAPKPSAGDPHPEFAPQGECGQLLDEDTLVLSDAHFARLDFSSRGLAVVLYGGAAFYVSESGKTVHTHFFDNGADNFVEGMARLIAGGKFGFVDEQLNVVVEPAYDFAFPFEDGRARVCEGCRFEHVGEHRAVLGGKWGRIDTSGKLVEPLVNAGEIPPKR